MIPGIINFRYIFKFSESETAVIDIKLDPATLLLIQEPGKTAPKWAELEFLKCHLCSYTVADHKYCPIAFNLVEPIELFTNKESFNTVDVTVITGDRQYYKKTSLQTALSSLLGIYMTTSGCPVMEMLKPMVRYHLPFSSIDETTFRTTSMYLLGQFFRHMKGFTPDWELRKLQEAYARIGEVNRALVDRIGKACKKDANLNAIVILDVFAKTVPMSIEDTMKKLEYLFSGYF